MRNDGTKLIFKKGLRLLTPFFSLSSLIKQTNQRIFLPFYHAIGSPENLPHITPLYQPRTIKEFENDLDYFLKFFEPVELDFLLNADLINPKALSAGDKSYFHLTFDDGLREIYDIVAPILVKKGIPATFFLNSNFVDNQDLFFRYKAALILDRQQKKGWSKINESKIKAIAPEGILQINFLNKNKLDEIATLLEIDFLDFLKTQKPYLTTHQIQSLSAQGFTVGGHSINHPLFNEILIEEQLRQATESTFFAKRITAQKANAFAFPFTDFGVKNTFFERLFLEKKIDISFGTAGVKKQRFAQHWQRFPMEGLDWTAGELAKTEYLYFLIKRMFGKG